MINRDGMGYRLGRLAGRISLIVIAYVFGKKVGRKPIDKFPKKK